MSGKLNHWTADILVEYTTQHWVLKPLVNGFYFGIVYKETEGFVTAFQD